MSSTIDNPFYYLDNFQCVLDWVGQRDADLLDASERALLEIFPTLPQSARALFVRMVIRKGEVFRASKLSYAEIGCAHAAAVPLQDAGLIEADPWLSLDELFAQLSKPEISATFGALAALRHERKQVQLEWLRTMAPDAQRYSSWHGNTLEPAWRILVKPMCERFRLLFFGNLHQDWSEFVLAHLGLVRYEQVALAPHARGFQRRADLDDYLRMQRCRERLAEEDSVAPLDDDFPRQPLTNTWLESRRQKLLFQCGQHHERRREWDQAGAIYAQCSYPGARARAIRVLEKQGRAHDAMALLTLAEHAPEDEAERQQLLRMAPRLARQLGLASPPRPRTRADSFTLQLPAPTLPMRVELAVLEHLSADEAPVFYVENTLATGLFGLLCWRAIFAPIPGAFFHPFQRGPVDLYAPDFHARRRDLFDACLAELESGQYIETIRHHHAEKWGVQSPFVHWEALDTPLLELALRSIPPRDLRQWFEHILADVRANRCGFPDLIQFWPAQQRYAMIEVKGPGDRLQDNQLRWIACCQRHAMPVSVCHVQWQDSDAVTQAMPAPAADHCG